MLVLFFLLLISSPFCVEPFGIPSFSDLKALFEFAYDVYGKLNEAHDVYNKFQTTASLEDIMATVGEISQDIDRMGTRLEKKLDRIIDTLLSRLPLINKIDDDSRALHNLITRINVLYEDFRAYATDSEFNNATLKKFAETITSHRYNDVNDILGQIHGLIFPTTGVLKESFVLLLSKEAQMNHLDLCDTGAPAQQRIFEIYSTIVLTEVRAYIMTGFAYTLLSIFEEGTFMREVLHHERKFERRIEQYLNIFKMAMVWAPRTLRRCDPPQGHIRDKTFFEFERFIGIYVIREDALTSDHNCYSTCDQMQGPRVRYSGCDGYECHMSTQTCSGTITDCTSGENTMQLCIARREEKASWHPRRYYWFKKGNGELFGNNAGGCEGYISNPTWDWKHTWYSCDVCMCTCTGDSYKSSSYHFISLREVVSDVDDNMIVTGLKFIRKHWVFQLQIQQGKLSPDGKIDADNVTWKEPEDIRFEHSASLGQDRYVLRIYEPPPFFHYSHLKHDKDVAILTRKKRGIHLDELQVPKDHVITGLKFSRISTNINGPIQLQIQATRFDYRKGTLLDIDSSVWITGNNMKGILEAYKSDRVEVKQLWNAKNPLDLLTTVPDLTPNKYIRIDKTGIKQDAGQTVVPLMDALEVGANPPLPLVGINLFHKRAEGYGGFLSLQIETVDRTAYIEIADRTKDSL